MRDPGQDQADEHLEDERHEDVDDHVQERLREDGVAASFT